MSSGFFYSAIVVVHVISMMSWVGAMYFNLVLLFPMYRSRGITEYKELMMTQGTRAVRLLYLFVGLTLISGVTLVTMTPSSTLSTSFVAIKAALWGGMLATHLYGTLKIWPSAFFALDSEIEGIFLRYRIWMAVSAAAGTVAIAMSIFQRAALGSN